MYLHYYSASYDIAQNISHVTTDRFLVHSHPFYELHYVISGDIELIYDGQIVQAQPHTLTLISPNVPHGIHVLTDKSYERYTAHFTPELLSPRSRDILLQLFRPEVFPTRLVPFKSMSASNFLNIFQELIRMGSLPKRERDALVPSMVESLLICLYTHYLDIAPMPVKPESSAITALDIRNYLDIHYTERLSLDELAEHFVCSKGYLNTVFKRDMDETIMQYIQYRRLQYAQALIENGYTALMASNIAGFSDYSGFYRAYVKRFGGPPSKECAQPSEPPSELMPRASVGMHRAPLQEREPDRECIWDLFNCAERPEEDLASLRDK